MTPFEKALRVSCCMDNKSINQVALDAWCYRMITMLCGLTANGSDDIVTIAQDDATHEWTISKRYGNRSWHDSSLTNCLTKAGAHYGITINDDPLDAKFI